MSPQLRSFTPVGRRRWLDQIFSNYVSAIYEESVVQLHCIPNPILCSCCQDVDGYHTCEMGAVENERLCVC